MLVQNIYQIFQTIHILIFLGQQTNGATTGCHLHFSVKIDGIAIDSLCLFHGLHVIFEIAPI